jgi:hypothetical protein
MGDRLLEQGINITFHVKLSKSEIEILQVLTDIVTIIPQAVNPPFL